MGLVFHRVGMGLYPVSYSDAHKLLVPNIGNCYVPFTNCVYDQHQVSYFSIVFVKRRDQNAVPQEWLVVGHLGRVFP